MEFGDDSNDSSFNATSNQQRGNTTVLGGITVDTAVGENTHTGARDGAPAKRSGSGKSRTVPRRNSSKDRFSPLGSKDRLEERGEARPTQVVLTSDDEHSSPIHPHPPVREVSEDALMGRDPSSPTGGSPAYGSTQVYIAPSSPMRNDEGMSPARLRASYANPDADPNLTRAETTLERALDGAASKLHRRMNVLYIAIIGFVLIGLCALACVTFGVVEIATNDKVFGNVGLGEVLTVLGIYFTVPYMFILLAFFVATHNIKWVKGVGDTLAPRVHYIFLAAIVTLYVLQQCFTDVYLVVLNSEWYLFVIIGDVAVFAALLYFHDRPFGHMLHMLLFALKLGLQWGNAFEATTQPVFGPNGVSVMLFLCIPLVQMPLQSSFLKPLEDEGAAFIGVGEDDDPSRRLLSPAPSPTGGRDVYSDRGSARHSQNTARQNESYLPTPYTPMSGNYTPSNADIFRKSNEGSRPSTTTASRIQQQLQPKEHQTPDTLSTFATNFNLYLSHLMHSLDIMSLYFFSFTSPETTEDLTAAPTPFRNFIAVLSIFAFVVNNLVVLHLFFHRAGILNVVIPGLPKVITSLAEKGSGVTRIHGASALSNGGNQGFLSDSRNGGSGGAAKKPSAETAADAHKAAHRVKMLQYMIIMLIVVDIPFVIARLELWRKQYSALSIFVAKNIKDIVDMTMLLSRNSNEGDDGEGGAGDGSGGDQMTGDERKMRGISVVIPNSR